MKSLIPFCIIVSPSYNERIGLSGIIYFYKFITASSIGVLRGHDVISIL